MGGRVRCSAGGEYGGCMSCQTERRSAVRKISPNVGIFHFLAVPDHKHV